MTRISKYVTDPRIKQLPLAKDDGKEGENGSIGTPATAQLKNLLAGKKILVRGLTSFRTRKKVRRLSPVRGEDRRKGLCRPGKARF